MVRLPEEKENADKQPEDENGQKGSEGTQEPPGRQRLRGCDKKYTQPKILDAMLRLRQQQHAKPTPWIGKPQRKGHNNRPILRGTLPIRTASWTGCFCTELRQSSPPYWRACTQILLPPPGHSPGLYITAMEVW